MYGDSEIQKLIKTNEDEITKILNVLQDYQLAPDTSLEQPFQVGQLLTLFTSMLSILHHDLHYILALVENKNPDKALYVTVPAPCELVWQHFLLHFAPVARYLEAESHFTKLKRVCIHAVSQAAVFLTLVYKRQEIVEFRQMDTDHETAMMSDQRHPDVDSRIQKILKTLRILARSDDFVLMMGDSKIDIIFILSNLMRLNRRSSAIQMECTAILANMASIPTNRAEILRTGCLSFVLENMKTFMDQPDIELEICAALANFALFGMTIPYFYSLF